MFSHLKMRHFPCNNDNKPLLNNNCIPETMLSAFLVLAPFILTPGVAIIVFFFTEKSMITEGLVITQLSGKPAIRLNQASSRV